MTSDPFDALKEDIEQAKRHRENGDIQRSRAILGRVLRDTGKLNKRLHAETRVTEAVKNGIND